MITRFRVVFAGELVEGKKPEEVKQEIRKRLKRSENQEKLEQAFTEKKPMTLGIKNTQEEALKLQKWYETLGANCTIEEAQETEPKDNNSLQSTATGGESMTTNNNAAHGTTATSRLIEQFERFFKMYQEVLPYVSLDNLDNEAQDYYTQRKTWIERLQQIEFPVAFLGSSNGGKSTIINAILNKDLLPESQGTTTAVPMIVKKGSENQAIVYYLDQDGKFELRKLLIEEIAKELHTDPQNIPIEEDKVLYLQRLQERIEEFEQNTRHPIGRKVFETLSYLLLKEHEFTKSEETISHEGLLKYVEGFEGVLFIDHIDVLVKDVDLLSDILLVDLPGLNVANQRHVKITKDYIQQDAKAFVICLQPNVMLEGADLAFLKEINQQSPSILQRSFWLCNQWDTLKDNTRRKQAEQRFRDTLHEYNFRYAPEKVFKVSALNYFLLRQISEGTLDSTPQLKAHLDHLKDYVSDVEKLKQDPQQAQQLLTSVADVKEFAAFQRSLFDYLNITAKEEFLNGARAELSEVLIELNKILEPLDHQYHTGEDQDKILFSGAVDRQLNPFIKQLNAKVEEFVTTIRLSENKTFLGQAEQQQIIQKIDQATKTNIDDLINKIVAGEDVRGSLSRLPALIEERLIREDHFRNTIIESVRESFIEGFLKKLLIALINVKKEYLPEDVVNLLRDQLSERDLTMRLYGLADSVLYQYVAQIDKIGRSLGERVGDAENDQNVREWVSRALTVYYNDLVPFIGKLSQSLNASIWGTLKNHAEYIKAQIREILEQQRGFVHDQIARKLNVSDTIALEKQKRTVLTNAYATLIQLRNEL